MTAATFHQRVDAYRERVEQVIAGFLDSRFESGSGKSERLESAVRYAANTTGKRIRALLSYATAEALSLSADVADQPAAAIELLHIYSLVHDDLPFFHFLVHPPHEPTHDPDRSHASERGIEIPTGRTGKRRSQCRNSGHSN